jgi:opacity protein-like surface antigen
MQAPMPMPLETGRDAVKKRASRDIKLTREHPMRLLATTALVLVLGTACALAADAPEIFIDDEAMAIATDWDGIYIGVGGNFEIDHNNPDRYIGGVGIIGVNVTMDAFLFGGEVFAGGQTQLPLPHFNRFGLLGGEVRGGYLVTEQVLLYGALGAEVISTGERFVTAGGGVEFKLTGDLSLDLEYDFIHEVGGVGYQGSRFGASVNWHFN